MLRGIDAEYCWNATDSVASKSHNETCCAANSLTQKDWPGMKVGPSVQGKHALQKKESKIRER
jgi:hypothetical protein